jgi:hydrogenase maturation protease
MPDKNKNILIIGIGNEFRSDDGAGIICARKLKEKLNSNTRVIENDGDGASLMESWKGFNKVILIDSVSLGLKPGTIHKIDAAKTEFPKETSVHSSHLFSVAEAIETSRVLNKLPEKLVVYGIEGKSYELGNKTSEEVNSAIEKLVTKIQKEI